MTTMTVRRAASLPVICIMWVFTILAQIPANSMAGLILNALLSFTSNAIAVYLICSRSKTDRINGFVRLILQVVVIIVALIVFLRMGVSIPAMLEYMSSNGR